MSYVLNQIVAPDGYLPASTIENVPIRSLVIDVANQAIYWQLKIGTSGTNGAWEAVESYMLPGSRVISSDQIGEIVGVRVRAAIPQGQLPAGAVQAVVSVRTTP